MKIVFYFTAHGVFISQEMDCHFQMHKLVKILSVKLAPQDH